MGYICGIGSCGPVARGMGGMMVDANTPATIGDIAGCRVAKHGTVVKHGMIQCHPGTGRRDSHDVLQPKDFLTCVMPFI